MSINLKLKSQKMKTNDLNKKVKFCKLNQAVINKINQIYVAKLTQNKKILKEFKLNCI